MNENWKVWAIGAVLVAAILGPAATGWSAGQDAALMTTIMQGVGDDEKAQLTAHLWEALGEYYPLLPAEQVNAAEQRAQAAGCEEDACLEAVRKDLGVPLVYRLRHVDEGYFNHLYMTRATGNGVEHKDYICSRCSFGEYKVILDRLLRHMHKK